MFGDGVCTVIADLIAAEVEGGECLEMFGDGVRDRSSPI